MSTIGSTLRDARTKKSVSLEEVHAKIKIHPRVLQLLEDEKFDRLPSPFFVKSFLKAYAEFLEIDAEQIVQIYEREGRSEPDQVLFIRTADERDKAARPAAVIPAVVAAVVVVALAGAAIAGGASIKKFIEQRGNSKSPAVASKKVRAAAPAAGGSPAAKKPREWLRNAEAGDFPSIPRTSPLELKVKAIDVVWMRVKCDGKVLFESILKRGASESWTAKDQIEIWTGNAANMSLTLNNYLLGSPGKGIAKKMILTHDGVKALS